MVSENYAKAYKEIIEILKYTKRSDVKKIPKEKITMWKTNMDEKWDFVVDTTKALEEQNILPETRAIMANIFYDYWATDYQKQRIDEKDKKNADIHEMQKREKYNPDNIFKNKQTKNIDDTDIVENMDLTIFEKDTWYKKLFKNLQNIFKRKNSNSFNISNTEKNSSINKLHPSINKVDFNVINGSLFGFFIGDALGVPVEFSYRNILEKTPVIDMMEYGSHHQPKGTWSDDSSMVLATIDGLINSKIPTIDYKKIMNNFVNWQQNGEYTPHNNVFDIGRTTNLSLRKYQENIQYNKTEDYLCGFDSIESNGNGSLMRILPIAFYLYFSGLNYTDSEFWNIIKQISSMTHAHIYSIMGCYIYSAFVIELLQTNDKFIAYNNLRANLINLSKSNENLKEMKKIYGRIIYDDISKVPSKNINSSGYVVDTLEATIWALLTSNTFEESVLKAINLGDDTDTIGALTGGLAGIIYSNDFFKIQSINDLYDNDSSKDTLKTKYGFDKWMNDLQKKDYLHNIVTAFINYLRQLRTYLTTINIDILNVTIDDLKNNKNACTIDSNPFAGSKIGEKLSDFNNYLYENDLLDMDYLNNHNKIKGKNIDDLNYNEVITELTFCFRGERFCSGFLYGVFKDETLLKLLERLKQIILTSR